MKESALEKLARSYKMQTLHSHNFKLFENDKNFSHIQLLFLNLVERYHQLAIDIATGEENTEEEMEKDPYRVEAYFLWRKENYLKIRQEQSAPKEQPNTNDKLYSIKFEDSNGRRK